MHTYLYGRRAAAVVVASFVALTLAACGGGGSDAGASVDASKVDTAAAKAKIAKLEKPIKEWPGITPLKQPVDVTGDHIMIVPLSTQVPILNGMAMGAKEALEHQGAQVTICDAKLSPTTADDCLKQAQSRKYDAVITNFVAFGMDPNGFTTLADSGTKILIAGDSQESGKKYPENVKFFDSSASLKQVSMDEADAAVARKGADANIIWLSQTDSANTIAQGDAGEARFKQICPGCGFQRIRYATQDQDKIPSLVSAALVSHPNTNQIVLSVDTIAPAVLQGMQSAGFTGKVTLIGNGSDLAGLQRIVSGQQTDDFGACASYDGFALANGLMQELAGEPVSPAVSVTRDFTKNNVGDLKLTPAEYDTADWFGNDSYKKEFYEAWGGQ